MMAHQEEKISGVVIFSGEHGSSPIFLKRSQKQGLVDFILPAIDFQSCPAIQWKRNHKKDGHNGSLRIIHYNQHGLSGRYLRTIRPNVRHEPQVSVI